MSVQKKDFGKTSKGEVATLYCFTNESQMEMRVSDYGATLVSVLVPDRDEQVCDVILGYDSAKEYEDGPTFQGATVGRNGNRIGNAAFSINGTQYQLDKNDNGNNLHSGLDYFSKRMWKVNSVEDTAITFSLMSPDGDQGYPGNIDIHVTYTLTKDNEVQITYEGTPDKDTIMNMTNHSYFNLSGHAAGTILDQEVWIDADKYTDVDAQAIPTGKLNDVTGTPLDFRTAKLIGKEIEADCEALRLAGGYDHNWALNKQSGYGKVASMYSAQSGIHMDVYTDLPGVQLYTGNFITEEVGKNNVHYVRRQALCFETQYYPDAINHESFASPVCKAGEKYYTKTAYKFYI